MYFLCLGLVTFFSRSQNAELQLPSMFFGVDFIFPSLFCSWMRLLKKYRRSIYVFVREILVKGATEVKRI